MKTRTLHAVFLSAWATTGVVAGLSGAVLSGQGLGPAPSGQTLGPQSSPLLGPRPSTIQHVTAATGTIPETAAAGKIALHVDVTPKPNIHVYAPGAKEFSAVSLVLTPRAGMTAGKPVYPAADPAAIGEDDVPAYRKTFRIIQPITVQAAKEDVVIAGVLNYQACDDRLCYPVASLPVSWTVHAR